MEEAEPPPVFSGEARMTPGAQGSDNHPVWISCRRGKLAGGAYANALEMCLNQSPFFFF